jgi:hypothetical protein
VPRGPWPQGEDRAAGDHHGDLPGRRHQAEPADYGGERPPTASSMSPSALPVGASAKASGVEGVHGHGGVDPDRLAVDPRPTEPPPHGGRRQLDQLGDPAVAEGPLRQRGRRWISERSRRASGRTMGSREFPQPVAH